MAASNVDDNIENPFAPALYDTFAIVTRPGTRLVVPRHACRAMIATSSRKTTAVVLDHDEALEFYVGTLGFAVRTTKP